MSDHVHSFGVRGRATCACGMTPERYSRGILPIVDEAKASGRYVYITTYYDGTTPIRSSLLFKTAEDASRIAEILSAARHE